MPSKIGPAVKARASRRIAEDRGDYPSDTALAVAVAGKVGLGLVSSTVRVLEHGAVFGESDFQAVEITPG
jgi:hypothetical protein